jgi:hypothetical protein
MLNYEFLMLNEKTMVIKDLKFIIQNYCKWLSTGIEIIFFMAKKI